MTHEYRYCILEEGGKQRAEPRKIDPLAEKFKKESKLIFGPIVSTNSQKEILVYQSPKLPHETETIWGREYIQIEYIYITIGLGEQPLYSLPIEPNDAFSEFQHVKGMDIPTLIEEALKHPTSFKDILQETKDKEIKFLPSTELWIRLDCDGHILFFVSRKNIAGYVYMNERKFVLQGKDKPGALSIAQPSDEGRLSIAPPSAKGGLSFTKEPASERKGFWKRLFGRN